MSRMKAASAKASSVRVTGAVPSGSDSVALDMQFTTDSSTGSLTLGGQKVMLTVTPAMVYIQGDKEFYKSQYGEAAATLLGGRWLAIPTTNDQAKSFATFANISTFTKGILNTSDAVFTKGDTTTVEGIAAVGMVGKGASDSVGTLYVATQGPPYPLQVVAGGGDAGKITMSEWDAPVTVTPPPADDVVDLTKLPK